MSPRERVQRWLEEAVIDLGLCPFARQVYDNDRVEIVVSEATSAAQARGDAVAAMHRLLAHDEIATTLVVVPLALESFDAFLHAARQLETAVQQVARGALQLATFHPAYQFEGTEFDDVENFTNRSPYPIFHLLRERDVSVAVDSHPNSHDIPEKNIVRLRALGRDAIAALWKRWS